MIRRDSERFAAIVAIQHHLRDDHRSLQEVMDLLAQRVQDLTLGTGGALALLDGGRVVFRSASGLLAGQLRSPAKALMELTARCVANRAVLRSDDTRNDPRPFVAECANLGFRSIVAVPLHYRRRVIGVLEVVAPEPGAFDDCDVCALQLLADLVAATVYHASESEAVQMQLVAERAAAEGRLRRTEERLRANFHALIELLPDLVIAQRQGQIVYVNPAAVSCLGHQNAQDLVGQPLRGLIPSEDTVAFEAQLGKIEQTGQPSPRREGRLVRRDGQVLQIEYLMLPLAFDGEPSVVMICRDITERNQMQARLLLADRMASVGMLAAGVAHEINNPLAYITANLDFAIDQLAGASWAGEVLEALREAREGARRVQQIVRDLKTFSRGEEEQRGPVDLRRVIEASINMAWNEIRHRARLVKDYGEVPPVEGNEGRLGQVFLNLLINAAQAIPAGQADRNEIRISTRRSPDGRVIVDVKDTGTGIPPDVRNRLFEPFFTTKPVGIGTGLGLTISQSIVSSMGGEITVESEVGRGSLFRVILPAATDRSVVSTPQPRTEPPLVRRGNILVVDDEPLVAAIIRRFLGQRHEVTVLTDGKDALEQIQSGKRFDVILCDLMMPNVSGMDFHEELSRMAPDQCERVIFVTGGAFSPQARSFLDRVPNLRIEKPFDVKVLQSLVEKFLK